MTRDAKTILLDIEGTASSITFVFDVLFPYARKHVQSFLNSNLYDSRVTAAIDKMAVDLGFDNHGEWLGNKATDQQKSETIVKQVNAWMDQDAKLTGLKELQGLIWKEGYDRGELKSHVYPDVPEAMERWVNRGITICIYSSGSIGAQKSFFKDTVFGDLTRWISDYFDTTSGPKREQKSYENIAAKLGESPQAILFLSDITDELKAANEAGMQAILVERPGNKTQPEADQFQVVCEFCQL